MKIAMIAFMFLFNAAAIAAEIPPTGSCSGLPQLANNSDGQEWDGQTKIAFAKNSVDWAGEQVSHFENTLDLAESEGEPVPTLYIKLEQNYAGDRAAADGYYFGLTVKDPLGDEITRSSTFVPRASAERDGVVLGLGDYVCVIQTGTWSNWEP